MVITHYIEKRHLMLVLKTLDAPDGLRLLYMITTAKYTVVLFGKIITYHPGVKGLIIGDILRVTGFCQPPVLSS